MARQLRITYEGAVYHITARGNEQRPIVRDDRDRAEWRRTLAQMVEHYRVVCHAWVLMDNHYHLLLETPTPNLSRAVRHLNGVYTQRFNGPSAGGASVSGPIQSHPGGTRGVSAGAVSVSGPQSSARKHRGASAGLGLEQLSSHGV
jgi:REP element-mobilizing transposase RayT